MAETKLTILPYGPPPASQESIDRCYELLLHCDADLGRIHDQVWSEKRPSHIRCSDQTSEMLEHFMVYASRLVVLRDPNLKAIVMLTQSCPITSMIVTARRVISGKFPVLTSALWIVYVDPDLDPSFERSALRLGAFDPADSDLDQAPYWRDDEDSHDYLMLTPRCDNGAHVRLRARMLAAQTAASFRREKSSASLRAVVKSDPPDSAYEMRKRTYRP